MTAFAPSCGGWPSSACSSSCSAWPVAQVLIIEGIGPLLFPNKWRN
ncbi:MAG TPA: DUF2065 domain-containing protein, partial [Chromatiaceae bacterium]|nr:DUF2065 domain-containing protein [Chromatiaceae bacterium]